MTVPLMPSDEKTTDGGYADIFRCQAIPDNGAVRLRLSAGPFTFKKVWYPTISKNDSGQLEFSGEIYVAPHDQYDHFLSPVAKIEREMKKAANMEKPSSRIKNPRTYLYVGIIRGKSEKLQYDLIELTYGVQEQLETLQEEQNSAYLGMRTYGLYPLYDITIKKTVKANVPKMQGTSYTLSVADPAEQAARKLLNVLPQGINIAEMQRDHSALLSQAYSEEEMAFFNSPEGNLEALMAKVEEAQKARTATPEETIIAMMEKAPLNLFAMRDNKFEFHNPHELFKRVQEATEVKLIEESQVKQLNDEITTRAQNAGSGDQTPASGTVNTGTPPDSENAAFTEQGEAETSTSDGEQNYDI